MVTEEKAKQIIERLRPLQMKKLKGGPFPCPRCGHMTMNPDPVRNAESRFADVLVCSTCGMDEALRKTPLRFSDWGLVLSFHPKGKEQENE